MTDVGAADAADPSAPIGPGPKLRAARTAMNVEIREVADALNLPAATIEAIEANDYAAMPSRVFARGYVRAYAKLVELDADGVVDAFSQASAPQQPLAGASATSINVEESTTLSERLGAWRTALENRVREKPLAALGVLAGGLLVLFIVLWLLLSGTASPDASAGAVGTAADRPTVVRPGTAPAPAPLASSADANAQRGGFTDARDGRQSNSAEIPPEPAAGAPGAIAASDQVRLGEGDDRLRFTFVADCWVEVRDVEERVLYGDLGQSGKQLELIGQGPFNILLGYAPGVRLAFNGENVVLAPHTRNDVAQLVLGQ